MTITARKKTAFTLVELLAVIGIIALLVAITMPALNRIRENARVSRDKITVQSLATACEQFKGDMGFYPPSGTRTPNEFNPADTFHNPLYWYTTPALPVGTRPDTGAHRLFEALAGLDKEGYQKEHHYQQDLDGSITGQVNAPIAYNKFGNLAETKRYGPYIDMSSIKYSTMEQAQKYTTEYYGNVNTNPVFVGTIHREYNAPILYYRANTNQRTIEGIYNYGDNDAITTDEYNANTEDLNGPIYPNFYVEYPVPPGTQTLFKKYLWDPDTGVENSGSTDPVVININKLSSPYARPYNKDSFIIIHPGPDNKYGINPDGTCDDITNFQMKDKPLHQPK